MPTRLVYPATSTDPPSGHSCHFCDKRCRLLDVEGRWGCTHATPITCDTCERCARRSLSGQGQNIALNLADPPTDAPGMISLDSLEGQGGALAACLADGQELLARRNSTVLIYNHCDTYLIHVCTYLFILLLLVLVLTLGPTLFTYGLLALDAAQSQFLAFLCFPAAAWDCWVLGPVTHPAILIVNIQIDTYRCTPLQH